MSKDNFSDERRELKLRQAQSKIEKLFDDPKIRAFSVFLEKYNQDHGTNIQIDDHEQEKDIPKRYFLLLVGAVKNDQETKLKFNENTPKIDLGLILNSIIETPDLTSPLYDELLHYTGANAVDPKDIMSVKMIMSDWVKAGRALDILNSAGQTPANIALQKGNFDFIKILATKGYDLTTIDPSGFTLLHRLIKLIDRDVLPSEALDIWIEADLPVNIRDSNGVIPAQIAEALKQDILVGKLLGAQGKVQQLEQMIFEKTKSQEINKFLEEGNYTQEYLKVRASYLLEKANEGGNLMFIKVLEGNGIDVVNYYQEALSKIYLIDKEIVSEEGIRTKTFFAWLLENAATKNEVGEIVHLAIFKFINEPEKWGINLASELPNLMSFITENPHLDDLAIEFAKKNIVWEDGGFKVLHFAVHFNNINLISELKGLVDFDQLDKSNAPPICQALVQNHEDVVKALIDNGADINIFDGQILKLLKENNLENSAKLAIKYGARDNNKIQKKSSEIEINEPKDILPEKTDESDILGELSSLNIDE